MAAQFRPSRLAAAPLAVALLGGLLAAVPVSAAAPSCTMTVTLDKKSSVTYPNGLERNTYKATVAGAGRTQTATVQRMSMPVSAQPRLVTTQLGTVGQLRAQLESKKGARGISAVNGDFFYEYDVRGDDLYLPRGASVTHGSPVRIGPEATVVVGIDKAGHPFTGKLGVGGSVVHGSTTFAISSVNWQEIDDSDVAVYTPRWADAGVVNRPVAAVEWVVEKKKIIAVRTGRKLGRTVEAGTKVVSFGADYARQAKRAKVGSEAVVAVKQVTATGVALREAVGRGESLVHEGSVSAPCGAAWYGQRPRTTVGWTDTGRWMALTLPGTGYDRHGYRIGGLGITQEAAVAKALGFDEAVALDGGGSTTAYVRLANNDWDRVDDPDNIYQRPIPNALVFVKH